MHLVFWDSDIFNLIYSYLESKKIHYFWKSFSLLSVTLLNPSKRYFSLSVNFLNLLKYYLSLVYFLNFCGSRPEAGWLGKATTTFVSNTKIYLKCWSHLRKTAPSFSYYLEYWCQIKEIVSGLIIISHSFKPFKTIPFIGLFLWYLKQPAWDQITSKKTTTLIPNAKISLECWSHLRKTVPNLSYYLECWSYQRETAPSFSLGQYCI